MKKIDKFKPVFIFMALQAAAIFLIYAEASAWSSFTHGAITAEALSKYGAIIPGAIYSSVIPDVTTNFISPASKDAYYGALHKDAFYGAALAALSQAMKTKDHKAVSNAYGYFSHVIADKVAHTGNGYPDAKKTFSVKTELNHYVAYFFMDLMCYYNYFYGYNSARDKFLADIDAGFVNNAINAYNQTAGEKITFVRNDYIKKIAMFNASIAIQKSMYDIIIDNNPELFEQIKNYYGDYYLGVGGAGGFLDAVSEVAAKVSVAGGAGVSESKLKSLAGNVKNEVIYAGMQAVSEIAQNTEFLRTGKVSSSQIEKIVNKFFESKSESTKSMGRFLSALFLKKGLTYEEIIALVDGKNINGGEKYEKYKNSYAKLKEDKWYSFIPGLDSSERKEYAENFINYSRENEEARIENSGLPDGTKKQLKAMLETRLENYRKSETSSKINPFDAIAKKAQNDISFTVYNFAVNYETARAKAKSSGDEALAFKLDVRANEFMKAMAEKISRDAKASLLDKIASPRKMVYDQAACRELQKELTALDASFDAAKYASAPVRLENADAVEIKSVQTPLEIEEIKRLGLTAPKNLNEARLYFQSAYKDYVKALGSAGETLEDKTALEKKLKIYVFYKNAYEGFLISEKKEKTEVK